MPDPINTDVVIRAMLLIGQYGAHDAEHARRAMRWLARQASTPGKRGRSLVEHASSLIEACQGARRTTTQLLESRQRIKHTPPDEWTLPDVFLFSSYPTPERLYLDSAVADIHRLASGSPIYVEHILPARHVQRDPDGLIGAVANVWLIEGDLHGTVKLMPNTTGQRIREAYRSGKDLFGISISANGHHEVRYRKGEKVEIVYAVDEIHSFDVESQPNGGRSLNGKRLPAWLSEYASRRQHRRAI